MVSIRELSSYEKEYWDENIKDFEFVHPFNAYDWGIVRSVDKWKPVYLVAESDGKFCGGMMLLIKRIPYTPFAIMCSPRGPVCDYGDKETLRKLVEESKKVAKKNRCIFLRIDPNVPESEIAKRGDMFLSQGFIHLEHDWSFWNSPKEVSRVKLNEFKDVEDIFNRLAGPVRRAIRKSAKEGVTVESTQKEKEFREYFAIFKEFSISKGFMSRGFEYQKQMFNSYISEDKGVLLLAKYKGKIIGGLLLLKLGDISVLMHIAAQYDYYNLRVHDALYWASIGWAKENNCKWVCFRGTGISESLHRFKAKFLAQDVNLAGYYDLPFRTMLYRLFYYGEYTLLPKIWSTAMSLRKLANEFGKRFRKEGINEEHADKDRDTAKTAESSNVE